MCNCGSKREHLMQESSSFSNSPENDVHQRMLQDVEFEYTGQTALTIIGSITGNKYRFSHPNSIQKIDYRDASGMMAVPVLKKVKREI